MSIRGPRVGRRRMLGEGKLRRHHRHLGRRSRRRRRRLRGPLLARVRCRTIEGVADFQKGEVLDHLKTLRKVDIVLAVLVIG